jgi:hypothetical protein
MDFDNDSSYVICDEMESLAQCAISLLQAHGKRDVVNAVMKVVGCIKKRNEVLLSRTEQRLQENDAVRKNAAKRRRQELLETREVEGHAPVQEAEVEKVEGVVCAPVPAAEGSGEVEKDEGGVVCAPVPAAEGSGEVEKDEGGVV